MLNNSSGSCDTCKYRTVFPNLVAHNYLRKQFLSLQVNTASGQVIKAVKVQNIWRELMKVLDTKGSLIQTCATVLLLGDHSF